MNNTVNMGGTTGELALAAAAFVLAYGLWVGRSDLGHRGMWQVLRALVGASVGWVLLIAWAEGNRKGFIGFIIVSVLSSLISFLPLFVAAKAVGVIRDASR